MARGGGHLRWLPSRDRSSACVRTGRSPLRLDFLPEPCGDIVALSAMNVAALDFSGVCVMGPFWLEVCA